MLSQYGLEQDKIQLRLRLKTNCADCIERIFKMLVGSEKQITSLKKPEPGGLFGVCV
jgi:hypothetical protein